MIDPKAAWYSIDVDAVVRWFLCLAVVLSLFLSSYLAYENHTLIRTNAELARYVTGRLDSLDAELGRIPELDISGALRVGGSRAVDSLLRRTEEE